MDKRSPGVFLVHQLYVGECRVSLHFSWTISHTTLPVLCWIQVTINFVEFDVLVELRVNFCVWRRKTPKTNMAPQGCVSRSRLGLCPVSLTLGSAWTETWWVRTVMVAQVNSAFFATSSWFSLTLIFSLSTKVLVNRKENKCRTHSFQEES
jgi:hypothetical protein